MADTSKHLTKVNRQIEPNWGKHTKLQECFFVNKTEKVEEVAPEKMMETSSHQRKLKRSWVEVEKTPRPSFLLEQSLEKRRISVASGRAAAAEGGKADMDEAVNDGESSGEGEAYSEEEEAASGEEEGSGEEAAEGSGNEEAERSDEEEANSGGEEGPGDENTPGEGASTEEPIFLVLSDPDVFDCPICYRSLTIPVYQCANGHTACSSCHTKLKNKCPSCSVEMSHICNRALERILQSTEVYCHYKSYGCQAKFSYQNRHSHEEYCVHAPFACPFRFCFFRGSSRRLSLHLNYAHAGVLRFSFNAAFSVTLSTTGDELVVLQEKTDWVSFILSCVNKTIKIGCFGSFKCEDDRFDYGIVVRKGSSYQLFRSFTEKTVGRLDDPPSSDFLQVPGYLFDSGGGLTLRVCIWKDAASVDVNRFINGEALS